MVRVSQFLVGFFAFFVTGLPAGAVDKSLDGFAKVRFGMTADEVKQVRPDAEYRPEVGEYWIVKTVNDPEGGGVLDGFRIRIGFSPETRVARIVNENLLAEASEDYAECRGHFDAMLSRMTGALGAPDRIATKDEPDYEFGQLYRATNSAEFSFNNGAAIRLYGSWRERPLLTRYFAERTCQLFADYYLP